MIDFKYELKKEKEKLVLGIVWLLPRWMVKWCAIRLMAHATTGKYANQVVPELTCIDALNRWEEKDD